MNALVTSGYGRHFSESFFFLLHLQETLLWEKRRLFPLAATSTPRISQKTEGKNGRMEKSQLAPRRGTFSNAGRSAGQQEGCSQTRLRPLLLPERPRVATTRLDERRRSRVGYVAVRKRRLLLLSYCRWTVAIKPMDIHPAYLQRRRGVPGGQASLRPLALTATASAVRKITTRRDKHLRQIRMVTSYVLSFAVM